MSPVRTENLVGVRLSEEYFSDTLREVLQGIYLCCG